MARRRVGRAAGCGLVALGWSVLLGLAGCGSGSGGDAGQAQHRSAALVAGTPESAQYDYDGAGNLRQVRAQTAPSLTVASFAPVRGGVGQSVVIAGSGFSSIAAQNTVRLNGTAAAVTWATPSELGVVVPAGAGTGRFTVTVGPTNATSPSDFTVVVGVEVADFTPKVGRAGTILTVTGSNFASTPAGNSVSVGGGSAAVTTASPTTLMAVAGADVTSGKVRVTAGASTGVSSADFYLLPSGASEQDVVFTARAIPGTPVQVVVGTSGKMGLLLFEGVQGQAYTLAIGRNTFTLPTAITVFAPGGGSVLSASVSTGASSKLDLGWLSATGTYTVRIQPAMPSTGRLDLTAFQDEVVATALDGPAAAMAIAAGQNGSYSFAGATGDVFAFAATALSTTPSSQAVTYTFHKPDGSLLLALPWSYPSAAPQITLPLAGAYRVRVSPDGATSASTTILLSRPLSGTLATAGTVTRFPGTRAGQSGVYTFAGTAGTGWTLRATASATFAGTVQVYPPSGGALASASLSANGDAKLTLGLLPASGTYRVVVTPLGLATGALDLQLVREAAGTLAFGAPAATVTLAAAQNGRYTFVGNAGDEVGMAVTALSTTPAGRGVGFTLNKPDGTWFYNYEFYSPAAVPRFPYLLPATGTYTMYVTPEGAVGATVQVLLSKPLIGTLSTGGTVTRFQSARPGQTGVYTFAGTAGRGWTLRATASGTFSGTVYVNQPSGATLAYTTLSPSGDGKLDLGLLPAAGTYKVVVTPSGLATGYVDLKLVREATGTMTIAAAAKSLVLTAAQHGRYTFSGASGDLLSLAVTALSTTPAGRAVTFSVLRPDGQTHSWNSAGAPATWQIAALPAAGIYTLRVMPDNTAAASFAVQLPRR